MRNIDQDKNEYQSNKTLQSNNSEFNQTSQKHLESFVVNDSIIDHNKKICRNIAPAAVGFLAAVATPTPSPNLLGKKVKPLNSLTESGRDNTRQLYFK